MVSESATHKRRELGPAERNVPLVEYVEPLSLVMVISDWVSAMAQFVGFAFGVDMVEGSRWREIVQS